jgi:predicted nucleic acid-binding protein
MFLIDTNVISELRRPDKADRNVVAWASAPSVELLLRDHDSRNRAWRTADCAEGQRARRQLARLDRPSGSRSV